MFVLARLLRRGTRAIAVALLQWAAEPDEFVKAGPPPVDGEPPAEWVTLVQERAPQLLDSAPNPPLRLPDPATPAQATSLTPNPTARTTPPESPTESGSTSVRSAYVSKRGPRPVRLSVRSHVDVASELDAEADLLEIDTAVYAPPTIRPRPSVLPEPPAGVAAADRSGSTVDSRSASQAESEVSSRPTQPSDLHDSSGQHRQRTARSRSVDHQPRRASAPRSVRGVVETVASSYRSTPRRRSKAKAGVRNVLVRMSNPRASTARWLVASHEVRPPRSPSRITGPVLARGVHHGQGNEGEASRRDGSRPRLDRPNPAAASESMTLGAWSSGSQLSPAVGLAKGHRAPQSSGRPRELETVPRPPAPAAARHAELGESPWPELRGRVQTAAITSSFVDRRRREHEVI